MNTAVFLSVIFVFMFGLVLGAAFTLAWATKRLTQRARPKYIRPITDYSRCK